MDGTALACFGGLADKFCRQGKHGSNFGNFIWQFERAENSYDPICGIGVFGISNALCPMRWDCGSYSAGNQVLEMDSGQCRNAIGFIPWICCRCISSRETILICFTNCLRLSRLERHTTCRRLLYR